MPGASCSNAPTLPLRCTAAPQAMSNRRLLYEMPSSLAGGPDGAQVREGGGEGGRGGGGEAKRQLDAEQAAGALLPARPHVLHDSCRRDPSPRPPPILPPKTTPPLAAPPPHTHTHPPPHTPPNAQRACRLTPRLPARSRIILHFTSDTHNSSLCCLPQQLGHLDAAAYAPPSPYAYAPPETMRTLGSSLRTLPPLTHTSPPPGGLGGLPVGGAERGQPGGRAGDGWDGDGMDGMAGWHAQSVLSGMRMRRAVCPAVPLCTRHPVLHFQPAAPGQTLGVLASEVDGDRWGGCRRWTKMIDDAPAQVVRIAPDGRVDTTVELPVTQPTSCTIGGCAVWTGGVCKPRDSLESLL